MITLADLHHIKQIAPEYDRELGQAIINRDCLMQYEMNPIIEAHLLEQFPRQLERIDNIITKIISK